MKPLAEIEKTLTQFSYGIHLANLKFWRDLQTGVPVADTPELLLSKIALMHSELSEMTEYVRKGGNDKHLPQRTGEEVELADLIIRALDYAARRNMDIGAAIMEKLNYNVTRQDHTDAARRAAGGKKV